jgi:SAM-dependent methyltransferase
MAHQPVRFPPPPRPFFMSPRDIAFWIQSARADARLARLTRECPLPEALDRLYRQRPDPWASTGSGYRYQRRKYQTLVSRLPARRYAHALDIGCGPGGLTRLLAPAVDRVLGIDLALAAVEQARQLSRDYPNVQFEPADLLALPLEWDQQFDLVVLADVLYYLAPLSDQGLKRLVATVGRLLTPGGLLLLVNHHFYFEIIPGARLTRPIHQAFRWSPLFHCREEQWRPFYLTSLLEKQAASNQKLTE